MSETHEKEQKYKYNCVLTSCASSEWSMLVCTMHAKRTHKCENKMADENEAYIDPK